jgi:radical SAM superfamily enzyme YgiQ (UPF0313 family)
MPYGVSLLVGFPGETDDTIEETINFVKKIKPDFVQVTPLGVLPNTPLSLEPGKYGIELGKNWQKVLMQTKFECMSKRVVKETASYYVSNGKAWSYWIQKTGDIVDKLEREGIVTQTVDDMYLMASVAKIPIREFRDKIRHLFKYSKQNELEELIQRSWSYSRPTLQSKKSFLWIP